MLHEVRDRSQAFHLRVTRAMQPFLSRRRAARAASEVSRSADRSADHYRIATFAHMDEDFRTHVGLAIEAVDECVFWLELLRLTEQPPTHELDSLITEGQELAGLLAAIVPETARRTGGPDRTVIV